MAAHVGKCALAAAFIGFATVQVLGRRAGSTVRERNVPLPGDDFDARRYGTRG